MKEYIKPIAMAVNFNITEAIADDILDGNLGNKSSGTDGEV